MAISHRIFPRAGKATGVLLFATVMTLTSVAMAEDSESNSGSDVWLPSLITETPQEGFALLSPSRKKGWRPLSRMLRYARRNGPSTQMMLTV